MESVDFRILGPLEVWCGAHRVGVAGARQLAILSVLLLHAGEVVSSDRLLDEVWGEMQPAAGATALRVRVSQLRRALGPAGELLISRPPGYVLKIEREQLDLRRFERLVEEGERALDRDAPSAAADALHTALALWRGPPLTDVGDVPFAQAAVVRLDDLRLAALELSIEAELALGHHARLVGELQALVHEHPLRERLCGQLMLALYRDGRQAEALACYRAAHRRLLDEVGLAPGPDLQALEQQLVARDPALLLGRPRPAARRAILVLAGVGASVVALAGMAEPLAAHSGHDLLIAVLVPHEDQLEPASARAQAVRADIATRGVSSRAVTFTSLDRGADALRLATEEDVALILLDASEELTLAGAPGEDVARLLANAVCDVALIAGVERAGAAAGTAVLVPFGGHEHEWAAIELGAWYARATGGALRLVGTRADPRSGRRDASRLLGHASLALQRAFGVAAEPVLVEPGTDALLEAAARAALIVAGLSDRWAREGLGASRLELARCAAAPVVLVRRGLRPGGLAPARALTRFTWSAG